MLKKCSFCKAEILTEANSFTWVSTPSGHVLACLMCGLEKSKSFLDLDELPQDWFVRSLQHIHSHTNAERHESRPLRWEFRIQNVHLGTTSTILGIGVTPTEALAAAVALIPGFGIIKKLKN